MRFAAGISHWVCRRRYAVVLLVCSALAPCCQTLYGVDTPRRSLQKHDHFEVDPQCPDLVIDSSSLAATLRVVTLTGRRQRTGLGAESVPVSVQIGLCDPSAAAPPPIDAGSGDAGSDAGTDAGTDGEGGAPSEGAENGGECRTPLEPLGAADQARFALVAQEGRGCRARSAARLECTLDANGEAAFGIVSQALTSVLSLNGYLPVCVTPLELEAEENGTAPNHRIDMVVTPRFGESRIAVAVAQLLGDEPPQAIEQTDGCVLRTCTDMKPRARFQAGVVSPDIPIEAIRASDFLQVSRDAAFDLSLRVLSPPAGGDTPFLSTNGACAPPDDAGSPEEGEDGAERTVRLEIASGQSDTPVFFLCAPGYSSSYEVVATLAEATSNQPLLRTNRVTLPSLIENYAVESGEDQRRLVTESCNDEIAQASDVRVLPPWFVFGNGQDMLLECRPEAGDDGAAGAAGAPPSTDDPTECSNVELELPQGTCNIPAN